MRIIATLRLSHFHVVCFAQRNDGPIRAKPLFTPEGDTMKTTGSDVLLLENAGQLFKAGGARPRNHFAGFYGRNGPGGISDM